MPDEEARLIVSLIDKASGGLGSLIARFASLGGAIASVTTFLTLSIKEALEQEKAVERLNLALKNQGIFTNAVSQDLQAYALQLSKVTTFSDETIIETETLLTTFGVAGQQLKNATKAAMDLSIGLGIDLRTAALSLGKVALGETSPALTKLGVTIDQTIAPSERLSSAINQLNGRVGGAAQQAAETTTGKFVNLKNRALEMAEGFGTLLLPAINAVINVLGSFLHVLESVNREIELQLSRLEEWAGANTTVTDGIIEAKNKLIEKATEEGVLNTIQTQERLAALDALIMKENEKTDKKIANLDKEKTQTRAQMDALKKWQDEQAEKNKKDIEKDFELHFKNEENKKKLDEERRKSVMDTLNFISSLSSSKIKELAVIGKAAASTQALIDTFAAANVALRSVPFPFNMAAAALVTTAGLANVGRIAGVPGLAEGGIVMPTPGGTLARLAEGGSAEAVIPLNDNAGGIGGMTININAGVIVADDYSATELAKMIDEKLYALNRTRQSVAFG